MEVSSTHPVQEALQEPFHIEEFSDEVLEIFFKYLAKNVKDFFSLSLVNRRFQNLAVYYRDNVGEGLEELVPSYLREVKDPAISGLSTLKKIRLARIVEANLITEPHLKKCFNTPEFENSRYTHKIIIGDHFIYGTKEFLSICSMKNNKGSKFQGTGIEGLLAVYANKTLLVGFRKEEFAIWDFNLLIENGNQKVTPIEKHVKKSLCFSDVCFLPLQGHMQPGPVADTMGHLLAVATKEHVLVIDCNSWAEIEIPFKSGRQIQFTDTHLMLISDKNIQIYETPILLKSLQKQETTDLCASFNHVEEQKIHCVKIDRNRLVVAFKEVEVKRNTFETGKALVGEVIDWQTNPEKSNKLYGTFDCTSASRINFIDTYGRKILTCSFYLNKFDFNGSTLLKDSEKSRPHEPSCVQVLGQNFLISYSGGEGWEIYDSNLKFLRGGTTKGFSSYVKLLGWHLITERASYFNTRKICIYDLRNQVSNQDKDNNNDQKSEKS